MGKATFSIRVVNDEGDGVESVKVCCFYGLLSGFEEKYTDDDGWVNFDIPSEVLSGRLISIKSIYVDGNEVLDGPEDMEDGDTRSFTI